MNKVFVTGGAGFIASHLEDILVDQGTEVYSADLLDPQHCHNIEHLFDRDNFHYLKIDISKDNSLFDATQECDCIYHLAANSDIQKGGQAPTIDYKNTFLTTRSVLESIRKNNIPRLFFSSTSAVYGNIKGQLDEMTGGLKPISYYGAAKLSSEAMISAYSYMCDFDALIFRFPNVTGPRLTHGVIFDFIKKLKKSPKQLQILGDGNQKKQYVYIDDLTAAIIDFSKKMESGLSLYNISTESFTDVNTIADLVCERMGLTNVEYQYTGGNCGWKGDVPSFDYNINRAKARGWKYHYNSTESIKETLKKLDIDSIH